MSNVECREPTQAGRFYPADSDHLSQVVRAGLSQARREDLERPAQGLVAPHAGYTFSGPTAAWAYRQVEDGPYRHVVVVAPSHYAVPAGGTIIRESRYRTPLGEVALCDAVVSMLRARSDLFADEQPTHREEHSLETQLPFLQVALKDFDLIPVVVSGIPGAHWKAVADALSESLEAAGLRLGEDTLVVASSDLYHGASADDCEVCDAALAAELERYDPDSFADRISRRELMACGAGPIAIMMRMTHRAGASRLQVLSRTNSQRVSSVNANYVVGYLAAVAY